MKRICKFDREARARAGRMAAQKMLQLYGAYFVEGACSKGGLVGSHVRWHVQRGKSSPECALCSEAT